MLNIDLIIQQLEPVFLEEQYELVLKKWNENSSLDIDILSDTKLFEIIVVSYIRTGELRKALKFINKKFKQLKIVTKTRELSKAEKDDYELFLLLKIEAFKKLGLPLQEYSNVISFERTFGLTKELFDLKVYLEGFIIENIFKKWFRIFGYCVLCLVAASLAMNYLKGNALLSNFSTGLLLLYILFYLFNNALNKKLLRILQILSY